MNKTIGVDLDTMMGLALITFIICVTIYNMQPEEHCECCTETTVKEATNE